MAEIFAWSKPFPVTLSYSASASPNNWRMKGKTKKGKVKTNKRTKAKNDDLEANLNSKVLVFLSNSIGIRPVKKRTLLKKNEKYLKHPETCSNPVAESSWDKGFTFSIVGHVDPTH